MDYPNFDGKFVWVWVGTANMLLESTRFEETGGATFLVGKVPTGASSTDYAEGHTINIRWSSVDYYYVFSTMADYQQWWNLAHHEWQPTWWQFWLPRYQSRL